jgi:hypothetical protein
MGMECSTAWRSIAGRTYSESGSLQDMLPSFVHVTLPSVHDTTGEEENVIARWIMSFPSNRQSGREPQTVRSQVGSLSQCQDGTAGSKKTRMRKWP